jgi:hypothetical protein
VSLSDLGLVIQLNHRGSSCSRPDLWKRDFTIVHVNAVHSVKIAYCRCRSHELGNSNLNQLFRERWFPASWTSPRTVFTFEFLNAFHIDNLQSKISLYDYYLSLLRRTNNAGLLAKVVSVLL